VLECPHQEAGMADKEYIGPTTLLHDSFTLAAHIVASGFRPDVLLVIWRGGTPIGIAVHEFLLYKGIQTYHAVVKAESHIAIEESIEPRVEHLDALLEDIVPNSRVLLVDDIFDTGRTMRKVSGILTRRTPHVKIATLYWKEAQNQTAIVPDFCLRKTDRWIVFPHELMDLTPKELRRKDSYIHDLVMKGPPEDATTGSGGSRGNS
jgi:hypoxanthine phosphoribosyltransferase